MSREIPIVLTPAEIAAHQNGTLRQIVRVAEKCDRCKGAGRVRGSVDENGEVTLPTCPACNGTGFAPKPLGQPGDVLVHQEEWFDNCTSIEDQVIGAPRVYYRAADPEYDQFEGETPVWQPADTMPEWASRYRLPVTSVELVRLWQVDADTVKRAGMHLDKVWPESGPDTQSQAPVWSVGCYERL